MTTTNRTRWAVLGPGAISSDLARGLLASSHGVLHAVGSRNTARAAAFAQEFDAPVAGTYEEILAREDVDAVYIGVVHTGHGDLAKAAIAAGKAVLCEKPLTPTAQETREVLAAAAAAGVPFLEAFKYRFGPLADRLQELIADGAIGRVHHVDAGVGFWAAGREGRLFDPALAGGGILDVGSYPASFAVGVAAWNDPTLDGEAPVSVHSAGGVVGDTGVDEWASAVLGLGGITAALRTAVSLPMPAEAVIHGSAGTIEVPALWAGRTESGSTLLLRQLGREPEEITVGTVQPMGAEADALSLALREGRTEVPEMPWAQSLLTARVLDAWRDAIG